MHVPAGHRFPDATGGGVCIGLGPPSLLAALIIRAQARKALLFSLGFFIFFNLFF